MEFRAFAVDYSVYGVYIEYMNATTNTNAKGSTMSLKLGTETASVTNYLMSGTNGEPTPVVGMGVTILRWTDRVAGTIIAHTRCTITVQHDKATRIDQNGMSEQQEYSYECDPKGCIDTFRKTKRGWRLAGGGSALRLGDRDQYHDYSF